MIERWILNNFKSVQRADLQLAPLTLFAGANSSGKSTLLQSILLISQTLSSRVATQTVLLNGHFTKLGQLDDLRPSWSEHGNIQIGWTVKVHESEPQVGFSYRTSPGLESVSGEITFGPSAIPDKATQLNPLLTECTISCVVEKEGPKEPNGSFLKLKRKSHTPRQSGDGDTEQGRVATVNYDFIVSMDDEAQEYLRDELAGSVPIGVSLQHFIPSWLVVAFDRNEEIAKAITSAITDPRSARQGARHINPSDIVLPQEVVTLLKQSAPDLLTPLVSRLAQKSVDPTHIKMTLSDLIEHARLARPSTRSKENYQTLSTELKTLVKRTLQKEPAATAVGLPGRILGSAVEQTSNFFSRKIRYLGPLRDEPRSMYPLHTTADPLDVGLHGEYTAAVFHNFQRTEISYIPSIYFANDSPVKQSSTTNLREAVFDWLAYLDVASKVDTRDEGKLGHGLSVFLEGSKAAHDLPHVGVGVSQVLPIVVMCLLAGTNTTAIIEQPELHLNPKVQTRLADFFLSMALVGKQCLVETHSEYLINRLRLRSALAHSDSLAAAMKLYFVEKVKGVTHYRSVKINEYGAIVDWPSGFFDQSQREIENILLAASEKVARKG